MNDDAPQPDTQGYRPPPFGLNRSRRLRGQMQEQARRYEVEAEALARRDAYLRAQQAGEEPAAGATGFEKIVVVGPCASGKSVLVEALRQMGFNAQAVAQEHSYIRRMWAKPEPTHLIYLDARLDTINGRRGWLWTHEDLRRQHEQLADARDHADLIIHTDDLSIAQVAERATSFLAEHPVRPSVENKSE